MDSAMPEITKEEFSSMIAELDKTTDNRLSPQKAAAMIDHSQQQNDRLYGCQTCAHFVPFRPTRMHSPIPKLDLCVQDIKQLKPLPPGAHGCEKYLRIKDENYMSNPDKASKGTVGETLHNYEHGSRKVSVKDGDIMIPTPKDTMTLVRVEKDIVILVTTSGTEYQLSIKDWDFDLPKDQGEAIPARPLVSNTCSRGDYLQIFSLAHFKYICQTQQQFILENQKGFEVPFNKNTYYIRVVSKADFRSPLPEYDRDVSGGAEHRQLSAEDCVPGDIVQIVSVPVFEFVGTTNKIYLLRNIGNSKDESVNRNEFGLFFIRKNAAIPQKVEVVGGSTNSPKS